MLESCCTKNDSNNNNYNNLILITRNVFNISFGQLLLLLCVRVMNWKVHSWFSWKDCKFFLVNYIYKYVYRVSIKSQTLPTLEDNFQKVNGTQTDYEHQGDNDLSCLISLRFHWLHCSLVLECRTHEQFNLQWTTMIIVRVQLIPKNKRRLFFCCKLYCSVKLTFWTSIEINAQINERMQNNRVYWKLRRASWHAIYCNI